MNLKYFALFNLGFLFSLQSNAMPDLLRLDEERVVYWQEKKLARKLSEYEKSQLLSSYIPKSGMPKSASLNAPFQRSGCISV